MPQTPAWLQSILEEHLEELGMLWELRQVALRDPDYVLDDVVELEERLEAHTDGLILGGERSLPILEQGLAGDEPSVVIAAAYVLLRFNDQSLAGRVISSFEAAEADRLDALRAALCDGPIELVDSKLNDILNSGPEILAVAAAEVLAYHTKLSSRHRRLTDFLMHADPAVRRIAWRTVALVDARTTSTAAQTPVRPYETAFRDDDVTARREALLAAAWTRQESLLDNCRKMTQTPSLENWDACWLLAVLGQPADLVRILAIGRAAKLGSRRFQVYASFGHPGVIDDLLMSMESKVANESVAAGAAFRKITGFDVASDRRVSLPPEDGSDPDDFENEFLDEAFLPNSQLARKKWQHVAKDFAEGTRWRCGSNVGHQFTPDVIASFDMESRWEISLRNRFSGQWTGFAADLVSLRRNVRNTGDAPGSS